MSRVNDRFKTIINEAITPLLKEHGFKKSGLHYYKPVGEHAYTLNVQKDKWNSKEEIKFTINLGIFSNNFWLHKFDYNKTGKIPVFPKEPESIIRYRIGEIKYGSDHWYALEAQRSERATIKEVESDIKDYLLTFFKKFTNQQSILAYLIEHKDKPGYQARYDSLKK